MFQNFFAKDERRRAQPAKTPSNTWRVRRQSRSVQKVFLFAPVSPALVCMFPLNQIEISISFTYFLFSFFRSRILFSRSQFILIENVAVIVMLFLLFFFYISVCTAAAVFCSVRFFFHHHHRFTFCYLFFVLCVFPMLLCSYPIFT